MKRLRGILADDSGAVQVIEASLIFPIVFLVVGFLIYLGSYTLQRISMYNHAQKIAVITSRELSFPGYEVLGAEKSSNADFNWTEGTKPSKANIESIMNQRRPYRYLISEKPRSEEMQKALTDMVNRVSYISKSDVSCKVSSKKKIMNTYIVVEVTKPVKMPVVMELLGIKDVLDINVKATAIVTDTSEFIRNVDTAYDLTNEIFERFGFNDKIESCMSKINGALEKLGVKG